MDDKKRIRQWANGNGFEVLPKGRIPLEVLAAYKKALDPVEPKVLTPGKSEGMFRGMSAREVASSADLVFQVITQFQRENPKARIHFSVTFFS